MAESLFGGVGRPTEDESQARSREFLRRVAEGDGLAEAAERSRVKPARALKLLDDPDVFAFVVTVRRGRLEEAA